MTKIITYVFYVLGFLPSIIWLLFYLRKDTHPESNRMIIKVFFWGMLAAVAAIFFEKGFQRLTSNSVLVIFLGGAFVEEYLKYLAVKINVFHNSEMDEPPDLLIYMIISALGFAAVENVLVLSNFHPTLTALATLKMMSWRFVSATFLHALCSALLGYFLALSFFNFRQRKIYFLIGLFLAVILHGIYNWSIMKIPGIEKIIIPLIVLSALAWLVTIWFKKLKRLKSVCKLSEK